MTISRFKMTSCSSQRLYRSLDLNHSVFSTGHKVVSNECLLVYRVCLLTTNLPFVGIWCHRTLPNPRNAGAMTMTNRSGVPLEVHPQRLQIVVVELLKLQVAVRVSKMDQGIARIHVSPLRLGYLAIRLRQLDVLPGIWHLTSYLSLLMLVRHLLCGQKPLNRL